jgi:hypothetical protein
MRHLASAGATHWMLIAIILFANSMFAGCASKPPAVSPSSPYYLSEGAQYYPPGPEFKLAREAAAMQEQAAALESEAKPTESATSASQRPE